MLFIINVVCNITHKKDYAFNVVKDFKLAHTFFDAALAFEKLY